MENNNLLHSPFTILQNSVNSNSPKIQQQREQEIFELAKEKIRVEIEKIKLENEEKRALVEILRTQANIGGITEMNNRLDLNEASGYQPKSWLGKFLTGRN